MTPTEQNPPWKRVLAWVLFALFMLVLLAAAAACVFVVVDRIGKFSARDWLLYGIVLGTMVAGGVFVWTVASWVERHLR